MEDVPIIPTFLDKDPTLIPDDTSGPSGVAEAQQGLPGAQQFLGTRTRREAQSPQKTSPISEGCLSLLRCLSPP